MITAYSPLDCSDLVEECLLLHGGETVVFERGKECPECVKLNARLERRAAKLFGEESVR